MKEIKLQCILSKNNNYAIINGTISKNQIKTISEKFRPKNIQ
ncbi:hypothetical protein [Clostridium botulinum]|nr:hypothetical protein [Clostridium botulinum]